MTNIDFSGDPSIDWKSAADLLASALQSFNPSEWFIQSEADMRMLVIFQTQWLQESIIPALTHYETIKQQYS
jgi:hypothetical protein